MQTNEKSAAPRTITVNTPSGMKTFTVLYPDLLRPLTPDERAGLEKNIRESGVVNYPVIVDEDDGIIDGINRLEVAEKIGPTIKVCSLVRAGLSPDQKRDLAVSLNEHRRHLTPDELRQLRAERVERVKAAREAGDSIRTIAAKQKVSVAQVQRDLEKAGVSPDTPESAGGGQAQHDLFPVSTSTDAPKPPAAGEKTTEPPAQEKKVNGRDGKKHPAKKKTGRKTKMVDAAVSGLRKLVAKNPDLLGDANVVALKVEPKVQIELARAGIAAVRAKAADLAWLEDVEVEWMNVGGFDVEAKVSKEAREEAIEFLEDGVADLEQIIDWVRNTIYKLNELVETAVQTGQEEQRAEPAAKRSRRK